MFKRIRYRYLLASLVGVSFAQAAQGGNTAMVLDCPLGQSTMSGFYHYFTPGDGTMFAGRGVDNGVSMSCHANTGWNVYFAAAGHALLTPGTYDGAVRWGSSGGTKNEFLISGNGTLYEGIGTFVVHEIVYGPDTSVTSFHATFSLKDSATGVTTLVGEVLWNASAPLPPDQTALHPPDEILYASNHHRYRSNGVEADSVIIPGDAPRTPFAFDRRGGIYVTDWAWVYDPMLGHNKVVGRVIRNDGLGHQDTPVVTTVDGEIRAIVCDKEGNLFLATGDSTPQITKVAPTGEQTVISTLLVSPEALVLDRAGNLFEADNSFGGVVKYTPTGERSFFATGFGTITGLAFDAGDNLFVLDATAKNVTKITLAGVKTVVASGFTDPQGLAINSTGSLFVGDSTAIMKCTAEGGCAPFGALDTVYPPRKMAFAPHPPVLPQNIATRAHVGSGQGVLIAGFIVSGPGPKNVIVRGMGPSLAQFGITNALANPYLEIHDGAGHIVAANDNWEDTQAQEIAWSGLYPNDRLESAISATLTEGAYTVVLQGKNLGEGVGVVEVYDMNSRTLARMANISTRSVVGTSENVLIGGFVLGAGELDSPVVVRAIGPSLAALQVDNALADPTLELHDKNGILIASNDNWREQQEAELVQTGLAPKDDRESAIIALLPAGSYTAIASGKGGVTGTGVVEIYHLEAP